MVVGDTRMLGTLHPTQWKKWNTWTIENNGSGLSGLISKLWLWPQVLRIACMTESDMLAFGRAGMQYDYH
jgi:hypothetical protein